MVREEVLRAFQYGVKLQHKKGGVYSLLNLGKMKVNGEWLNSLSYSDSDGRIYTRDLDNFKNFKEA